MNVATYSAFRDEMEKISWHAAAEVAGLGMLAAPTIQKMRGKKMSDKGTNAAELGGLGVLAAPAVHSMYSAAKKGGWAALKHASATEDALSLFKEAGFGSFFRNAAADASSMAMKGLNGGGAKSVLKGVQKAPARLAAQAPRAVPSVAQVGGHAFKPATTGKYAPISIPGLT